MGQLFDLVRQTTATTGTGTVTLGAAISGLRTVAAAAIADGTTVSYAIKDNGTPGSETGNGVTGSSGTTLTRSVIASTNSNALLNLSGNAEVLITPHAADIQSLAFGVTTIASAATTDIGSAATEHVSVTGTTTITSLGVVINKRRYVTFTGALTLTYNATSLILPTAANITTSSGDNAIFLSDGSGNWTCVVYMRANGKELYVNAAYLDAVQSFTKAQRATPVALTSSAGHIASDFSAGNNFSHTFTENTQLDVPSNLVAGQSGTIVFTQPGASPKTLTFDTSKWKFTGGTVPSVTNTINAVDVMSYYVESSSRITASFTLNTK